uniref:Uncharacterized protein n=1 Tax=Arundo donax TaxID=35708 RepID=A0A0A9F7T6_ARUDO
MKAGYSHKTASPFADMLAFRKVSCSLDQSIKLRNISKPNHLHRGERKS